MLSLRSSILSIASCAIAPVYRAAIQADVAARLAPIAAWAEATGVPEPAASAAADPAAALQLQKGISARVRFRV